MVVYKCEACIFSTEIKQHYQRHLTTNKHLLTQKVNIKSIPEKVNVCKYCERQFSCKQKSYFIQESFFSYEYLLQVVIIFLF